MADANPFEDAAAGVMQAQTATIRNNIYNAVPQNPATVAQHSQIAQNLGVPLESVQADPNAAKQQAAMQSFDANKLVTDYPHLAQFITDPVNAAKSHTDLPTLAATEQAVKGLPKPATWVANPFLDDEQLAQPEKSSWLANNLKSIPDLPYSAIQGLGGSFNQAAKAVSLAVGGFPTLYDKAASLITGQNTTSASDAYFRNFVQPLDDNANAFNPAPNATFLQKLTHGIGGLVGTLSQIAATGGMGEAPAVAEASEPALTTMAQTVGHAAKSMAFPSISGAVNTGNEVYQKTGSTAAAVKAAIASYGTNTAMGVLPLSVTGSLATRAATGFPVGILMGEANRQAMNAALPGGMQQQGGVEDAIINGLTGSILAGAMGPNAAPHEEAIRQSYVDAQKAEQATVSVQHLQALGELAKSSELRKNDPQAFHDFVQSVSEDGHLPEVWIDSKTLVNALNQSGVPIDEVQAKMPDVAAQLHEAMQTGGDVRISTADYATNIAGGPLEQAILPHLKTDPDGMTYQQGQEHLANQQADMTAQAQDLADKQAKLDQRQTELKGITDNVQQQLEATGRFPPDVAKQYAALHGAFYDNMSERMGIGPEEMRQRMPLTIKAEGQGGLSQGERGFYDPATGHLGLLKDADLSTFLHESGHFFLESMHDLAKSPEAPQGIKDDFDTLLQHFKVGGDTPESRMADWTGRTLDEKREGHEQFAEGFEKYLMTGKAPVPELQSMFSRFRSWLMNVYKTLGGEVSPEVRGVMDRMFASQEAITEAERVRAYATLDLPGEHGDMIDQYKALGREATEQAIADMQARSMRDMKWASNAKSRAMKELQRTAKDERAKITDEVTKEVMAEPVNKARTWLTKGEMEDAEGNPVKAEKGYKLNTDDLKEMFPPGALDSIDLSDLKGMTSKDGLHPDLVADMFGFSSGKDLVHSLATEPTTADKIKGMTDQRMLERHGDLTDPVSVERAAEAAIHNEVRAKMMATGLKMFIKSPMSVNEINKAAKAAADTAIAQKKVGDLRPAQYSAAEAKANKDLLKLAPKDPMGAAQAQRAALLNNRLFKSANEAVADVRKILTYMKRFDKVSTLKAINGEERDQITSLLKNYDFRISQSDEPTRAQKNLQQWLESQQMAGYTPAVDDAALKAQPRTQYRDMSVEALRGLYDTVRSIESIGKNKLMADWKGARVSLNDLVQNEFIPKMQERENKFTADELYNRAENRSVGGVQLTLDKMASAQRSAMADLKAQSFKANHYDAHEILGPFHELFDQVFNANYKKIDMTVAQSAFARDLAARLGKDWQKSMHDMVENTTLIDAKNSADEGKTVMMPLTRDNLIQMAAHSGNESNFDKLAKGYDWKPEDVWKFLDSKLSKSDAEAVKAQWEMANKHWPDVKAMLERMGQVAPPKIEPRPYKLRLSDGTVEDMPGGYMPIRYDPLRSRLGEKQQAERSIDPEAGRFGYDFFGRDTTTNGSMNARVDGYTDAIDLTHATLERAMAETIHDLAYREALVNANKIITHPDFRSQFKKTYGPEDYDALHTWLGRIANSENMDRQAGTVGKVLRYTRTGMVMNAIALRVSTVFKHGGSAAIKTMGYFAGGGEKYYLARQAAMATDYKAQLAEALEKFPEIRARVTQQDRDYRQTVSSLFQPESLRGKAERFGHAAVAWADLFTAVATAHGAYDRATTEGIPENMGGTGQPMTHAQAVSYANQIVREAHGSQIESARSNIMTNPHEGVKMFTTLYGFMNNTLGQAADMVSKLNTAGISKPEVLARSWMALIMPALWAGVLTEGLPSKDDWGKWLGKALGGEALGMIPFARDAYSFIEGYRHAGVVGAESWMQSVIQPVLDAKKAAEGKPVSGAISHAFDAAGMGLHIPGLGQIGKSAQYVYDVQSGAQHPANALEYAKGITVGAPKKK